MSARRRRRRNLNLYGMPTMPGATMEYSMLPPTPTMGDDWYAASTVQVPPPGANGTWVYWPGGEFGWLYAAGTVAPTQVRVDATQAGGPTGLMVHATPTVAVVGHEGGFTEALAPFSQGSSVRTTAGAPVRSVNPSPSFEDVIVVRSRSIPPGWSSPHVTRQPYSAPVGFPAGFWVALFADTSAHVAWHKNVVPAGFTKLDGPFVDSNGQEWLLVKEQSVAVVGDTPYAPYGSTYHAAGPVYPPTQANRRAPVRQVTTLVQNPEPSCTIDLDALRLSCPGMPFHGATVVDVGETNGDLVTVTFVDPVDGQTKSGRFPIAPYQGTPWWKHDGHCCEECALGNECEGDECSIPRAPNPAPRRRPVFAR